MKTLKNIFWTVLLAGSLPRLIWAQSNSMETEANLKNTTHVVERKIAIVVQNRASTGLNDKVAVLEDLVASRVAGRGFSVISRSDVTDSMKNYSITGVAGSSQDEATAGTTKLDQALNDNSSALRLAQNLGADYLLVPSIISLGTEKKSYNGNGIGTLNITHRLRVSYKIVEAGQGGAVRGGAFTSEKNVRQTADLQTEDGDVVNELLDDAADQLAEAMVQSGRALPAEAAKAARVKFKVACTMTDPRQQPILISTLGITSDNQVVVTNAPLAIQPMDVTVELDGVAIGSAPGEFQGLPGLHKLRLSREGFDAWERTVNLYDGETLRVAIQMSDAGYAKWKDTTDFLATLDANRKLTDAEVKRVEGIAEFFKNSHYRVDTKDNFQVTYKSLF